MNPQLLLAYDFPPIGGGIARMMGELTKRYPPGTLVVSTGRHEGSAAIDAAMANKVERVDVPSRRLRTVQGLLRWSHGAARLARLVHPEFVWCGNLKPAGYPARWIQRRQGTPYGILLYGTDLLLLRHRIRHSTMKRVWARTLIGSATALVAISRWTRQEALSLLEELGLSDSGIDVRLLPLGTDPEQFRPRIDVSSVRARYGLPEGRWLLTVARLVAHKGIDTALHVLAALREQHPDLRYLVVGRGNRQRQLEDLARDLDVADRVRFLTDVPDSDLPALYNTAEIYLGLSRPTELMVEGFGISLSEASASGIPVVAGADGGIPDAVRDGQTGLLVDAEGPQAAIAAVRLLLEDRELARRLGAEGRRAVETYYNWKRVAADLAAIGHQLGKSCRQEVTR